MLSCSADTFSISQKRPLTQRDVCVQLDMAALYQSEGNVPVQHLAAAIRDANAHGQEAASLQALAGIVWTPSMRRMYTLVDRSAARRCE